jgi:site-specific recombinase XerD
MQTYKSFVEFCKQHYKELSFQNLREDDIYAFIEYKSATMNKQGDVATSTANAIISHLKRLFKHIERNSENGLYDFDKVFEDIKLKQPKRVPKGLSDEQVNRLLNYLETLKAKETLINFRNIILFKLMLFGGLRASEAVSIKFSDIKEVGDKLYKITFKGKGDKNRFTYVQKDDFEDEITTLKGMIVSSTGMLIATTASGKCMDRIQLSKMVNSIYKRAGIKASGVHILRHTAAKRLLANGVSIVVVQSLLGHSSIQTTSIYANPTEDIILKEMIGK